MDYLSKVGLQVRPYTESWRIGLLKFRILVLQSLQLIEKPVVFGIGNRWTGLNIVFILIPAEQV